MVLATLQKRLAGTWIAGAVAASGKFTIYLNKSAAAAVTVAYIVLD